MTHDLLLERYDHELPLLRERGERLRDDLAGWLAAETDLEIHSVTLRLRTRASLEQMREIFRGYALFFFAHAEVLRKRSLGLDNVERLARLYRAIDYPDDERAAQLVASRHVEAFAETGM